MSETPSVSISDIAYSNEKFQKQDPEKDYRLKAFKDIQREISINPDKIPLNQVITWLQESEIDCLWNPDKYNNQQGKEGISARYGIALQCALKILDPTGSEYGDIGIIDGMLTGKNKEGQKTSKTLEALTKFRNIKNISEDNGSKIGPKTIQTLLTELESKKPLSVNLPSLTEPPTTTQSPEPEASAPPAQEARIMLTDQTSETTESLDESDKRNIKGYFTKLFQYIANNDTTDTQTSSTDKVKPTDAEKASLEKFSKILKSTKNYEATIKEYFRIIEDAMNSLTEVEKKKLKDNFIKIGEQAFKELMGQDMNEFAKLTPELQKKKVKNMFLKQFKEQLKIDESTEKGLFLTKRGEEFVNYMFDDLDNKEKYNISIKINNKELTQKPLSEYFSTVARFFLYKMGIENGNFEIIIDSELTEHNFKDKPIKIKNTTNGKTQEFKLEIPEGFDQKTLASQSKTSIIGDIQQTEETKEYLANILGINKTELVPIFLTLGQMMFIKPQ